MCSWATPALHGGEVFKKVKSSKCTYQLYCSTKKFLWLLDSSDSFKGTIVKHLNKLLQILEVKELEFTRQLALDYDLMAAKVRASQTRITKTKLPSKGIQQKHDRQANPIYVSFGLKAYAKLLDLTIGRFVYFYSKNVKFPF